MLRAVVIDDERKARETLRQMLGIHCPNIQVVDEADGVETGYRAITARKPDVVFLDMQMNDGNGFDLLHRLETIDFQLIIVTAHQEYAAKAFRFSAVDYLLKPIAPSDLVSAMEKVSASQELPGGRGRRTALLANADSHDPAGKKLVLKTVNGIHVVDTSTIVRCESHNNTTEFIFTNSAPIRVSHTLKEYEELLAGQGFIRCHQSHLINQRYIAGAARFPLPTIKMCDNAEIPVAIRKKEVLKSIEQKLRGKTE